MQAQEESRLIGAQVHRGATGVWTGGEETQLSIVRLWRNTQTGEGILDRISELSFSLGAFSGSVTVRDSWRNWMGTQASREAAGADHTEWLLAMIQGTRGMEALVKKTAMAAEVTLRPDDRSYLKEGHPVLNDTDAKAQGSRLRRRSEKEDSE